MAALQVPLLTVQTNELVPTLKPFTCEEKEDGEVTTPEPPITDQAPEPSVGLLAAKVAEAEQTVWLSPAFETGAISRIIRTVEVAATQVPLDTVHTKAFVPVPKLVIWETGLVEDIIVPLPDNKVQTPEPTVGLIAAIVAVLAQSV